MNGPAGQGAAVVALLLLLATTGPAAAALHHIRQRTRRERPIPGAEDTGLIGWHKPPAPPPARGGAGQTCHRGSHMVIDVWECGCIHTWTRQTGWVRDNGCLDAELRGLLNGR